MNYSDWKNYFLRNQSHFKGLDIDTADILTQEEKSVIYSSLQQFQRGENSEGKHLFSFAKTIPDPEYLACISLFIREEQAHARVLGAFMDKHGVTRIKKHWVDGVFRWLRQLAGLENTIRVLLTAEIIAKVYYKALHHATDSRLLKTVCVQILKDEDQHIAFQCFTLIPFYKRKSVFSKAVVRSWHFTLMTGTIIIVWLHHRKVLRKGGYSFKKYLAGTLTCFFEADRSIREKRFTVPNGMIVSA